MVTPFLRAASGTPITAVTKLRPPPLPPRRAASERLLRLLDAGDERRLTLVTAPPGFGKTSLLAAWAARARRPVAWLSLDEDDRDSFRLWAHVPRALALAVPALTPLAEEGLPLDDLIPKLLRRLADHPLVLMLDDFDRLGPGASEGSLTWFISHAPASVRVVVGSRRTPAFAVASLRAHRQLLELDVLDLRLTELERLELARTVRPDLDADERRRLCDRSDGWPAVLQLQLRAPELAAPYLLDEVVAPLDPDLREFLSGAAVLDELSGPLCDAVLARSDSADVLRDLERVHGLLHATRRPGVYRMDEPLLDALRRQLERGDRETARVLHRRAAAAHVAAGRLGAATRDTLDAGDLRRATRLVARSWSAELGAGRRAQLRAAVDRLPHRLPLPLAWLLQLEGRPDEAGAALAGAHDVERDLHGAAFCWDDVGAAHAAAQRLAALQLAGPARATAAWGLGWSHWWRGEDALAARALAGLDAPPLLACAAAAVRSRIALAADRPDDAVREVQHAQRVAVELDLDELPELSMIPTAAGLVLARCGEDAAARRSLERGAGLARRLGHPLVAADALVALAQALGAAGSRSAAADLLAEAADLAAECRDPGVLPQRIAAARLRALPRPALGSRVTLSAREVTVLRLLATGRSKSAIAAELHLSFNTVHSHTKSVYRKLQVSARADAIARGKELGLV